MLKITDLSAGYADLPILKQVSLELVAGTISVLMGPNGAGKSTLLKSIFHLTNVTEGKIEYEGKDITRLPAHELLKQGIGFVSQGRVNFGTLSVKDNLLLGVHYMKDKNAVEARLQEVYAQFPALRQKENVHAFALSGGEQQMVAIARALMSAPKLLLLDEPSLGLSPKLVKEVFRKIQEIRERFGVTILIVEHNLKSLMTIADYGYVLFQGEIIAHDTCGNLKNSPVMKQVFVGAFD